MPDILYIILAAVLALGVGIVVGRQLAGKARLDHEADAKARAQQLIQEAETQATPHPRRADSAIQRQIPPAQKRV